MENLKKMFIFIIVLGFATIGCKTKSNDDTYKGVVKVSGASQKGPLQTGSSVIVNMFDVDGVPTGDSYPTTISDDLGSFSVVAETTGPSELVAQGFYFNEISNRLSGSQITLRAVYDIVGPDPQTARINVFTHMASGLALSLIGTSTDENNSDAGIDAGNNEIYTATTAEAYAEAVLFQQLGIIHPLGALEGYGTEMDLTGSDSPDNQYIMAVSCIIANAANLRAVDEDEVDARLQELINDIRSQLTISQAISDEYKGYLVEGETSLDPMTECVDNLVAYLEGKTGLTPSLPNPNTSVDIDQDGIPNASDPDIDGDGFLNEDDEEPLEKKVGNSVFWDAVSGLAWERTASSEKYTQDEAIVLCENSTVGDYEDWRLPSISELRTLIRDCPRTEADGGCGVIDECLDYSECQNDACIGCPYIADFCYQDILLQGLCDFYRTSSAFSESVYVINFNTAMVEAYTKMDKLSVRCVRDI